MVRFIKKEDLKPKERIIGLFYVAAFLSFIILTFIAMRFYPGGYSLTKHTFSYLGQIRVNGVNNTISRTLFIIASALVSITLIPFCLTLPILFKENNIAKILGKIGSLCGVVSAPFALFIALIPLDWGYDIHMIPTNIFFFGMATMILLFSIAMLYNPDYKNIYGILGIIFCIIVYLYIFRFFDIIRPTMQKIIVYGYMIWTFCQVYKIWKVTALKEIVKK